MCVRRQGGILYECVLCLVVGYFIVSKTLGQQGEDTACRWLEAKGYKIVARNWLCPLGEIDIVTQIGNSWVFVEVRTRHGSVDDALSSIGTLKRQRMIRAAHAYIESLQQADPIWRIDVIAVAVQRDGSMRVEHVEDALDW